MAGQQAGEWQCKRQMSAWPGSWLNFSWILVDFEWILVDFEWILMAFEWILVDFEWILVDFGGF